MERSGLSLFTQTQESPFFPKDHRIPNLFGDILVHVRLRKYLLFLIPLFFVSFVSLPQNMHTTFVILKVVLPFFNDRPIK